MALRPLPSTTRSSRCVRGGDVRAAVAKLIYASNMSLDGCTEDERGAFDWAPPDDDVFACITDLMRSAGTYLDGRRMYETMAVWETDSTLAAQSDLTAHDAKVCQAADKVVYSSSLAAPSTANTRLERHFDPSAVHDLKAAAGISLWVARTSQHRLWWPARAESAIGVCSRSMNRYRSARQNAAARQRGR
jgi:hypothetical protein